MALKTEKREDSLVIHLNETFDFSSIEEFKSAYDTNNADDFTVDFSDTDRIDTGGLGMLLSMKRRAGGRPITLTNCKSQIHTLLIISHLDEQFVIC